MNPIIAVCCMSLALSAQSFEAAAAAAQQPAAIG
jgi:hypothetical protein